MAPPRLLGALLLGLLLHTWQLEAQLDEALWSESFADALDTLSVNNCTPELLWAQFQFSKAQVFELVSYRTAMGGIEDPLELYALREWDSTAINLLFQLLPLKRPTTKAAQFRALQRFRATSTAQFFEARQQATNAHCSGALAVKLAFTMDAPAKTTRHGFLWAQAPPPHFSSSHKYRLPTWNLGFGDFRLSAGQGLNLSAPAFPSPSTAEIFSTGLRGVSSSYAAGAYRGVATALKWRSWQSSMVLDTAGTLTGCLYARPHWGTFGLTHRSAQQSAFATYHSEQMRAFGELTSQGDFDLGLNNVFNDLLVEFVVKGRSEQPVALECYLSWRDSWGQWNVRRTRNRWFLQWQRGPWTLTTSEHRAAEASHAPTYRHKLRWQFQWGQMDLHYHAGSRGITYQWSGATQAYRYAVQASFIHANGHPVYISAPTASGGIPALGVYRSWAGLHLKAQWRQWQASMSTNFAQTPVQWNVALTHTGPF